MSIIVWRQMSLGCYLEVFSKQVPLFSHWHTTPHLKNLPQKEGFLVEQTDEVYGTSSYLTRSLGKLEANEPDL